MHKNFTVKLIIFQNQQVDADLFTLMLPLNQGHEILALIVFLGGFSAAISMVVIATWALSTMLSNNLIIPYGFLTKYSKGESTENTESIHNIRRIAIFSLLIVAYFFYRSFTNIFVQILRKIHDCIKWCF